MVKARILTLLFTAAIIAGCGSEQSTDHTTPTKAFQTTFKALDAKDWKTFAGCLTPESRNQLAGRMVHMVGQMSMDPKKAPELKNILKKYGVDASTEAEQTEKLSLDDAPKVLAKSIKDTPGFIAEMMAWMEKHSNDAGSLVDFGIGKLADLKVDGTTANAVVVITRDGQEHRDPIEFRKIEGRWFVHMTKPTESRSMDQQVLEGTVTLDGTPLAEGSITLRPLPNTRGPVTVGQIKEGKFLISSEGGTLVGWFRVEITATRKTGRRVKDPLGMEVDGTVQFIDETVQLIPARYNRQSKLQAKVTEAGPNQFVFRLTTK